MVNLSNYTLLFIDWETFYDTKGKYDLKSVSMTEYVRDSRFQIHGMGYKIGQNIGHWVTGEHVLRGFLMSVDWAKTVVVAHNVKFDGSILAWKYGVKPAYYLDTQCMAKAVLGNNVSSYSLRALAEYLGLEPKGELKCDGKRELTASEMQELADYCKHDTELCAEIFYKLIKDFPASQIPVMDWTIRAFIEPKLQLNVELLERMVEDEKERREKAIAKSGLTKAELSSNKQFSEHLQRVGINGPKKISVRTGKAIPALSLSDEGFIALKDSHSDLYEARVAAKSTITETRGGKLINVGKTGLFPFDVQFSGAVQTHRFSGSNGGGGNPQNFPRKGPIREAVCAPAGHELVVGDFAAIELRIISWLAREPKLINPLIQNTDIYSEFASKIYGKPINKKEHPVERQFGKCAILGLGYGMGWEKFSATVKKDVGVTLSEDEARKIVNLYRDYYFNIPKLWKQAQSCLPLIATGRLGCLPFATFLKIERQAIVLPSGLKIRYPNLRQEGKEWVYDVFKKRYESEPVKLYGGKLIENICQALAGEVCKLAISEIGRRGWDVVGQVHDEIIVVAQDFTAKITRTQIQRFMEQPVSWFPALRLKAEVGHGKNWAQAKAA